MQFKDQSLLTERQFEVLRLASLGYSYEAIGNQLGIKYRSVKSIAQLIFERLECKRMYQAVAWYYIGDRAIIRQYTLTM